MALEPTDQAGFLDLWRGVLPESYTGPIEQEGAGVGLDIPASHAAMWATVEDAFNLTQQGYYLRRHSTQTGPVGSVGSFATGQVLVARAAPTLGTLVLPQGTVFLALTTDSLGAELLLGRYLSTAPVTLTEGALGPFAVPVVAEFLGYTGNLDSGYLTEFQELGTAEVPCTVLSTTSFGRAAGLTGGSDRFDPGIIGRYVRLVGPLTSENRNIPRRIVSLFTDGSGELGIVVDLALDKPADVGLSLTVEVEEYAELGLSVSQPVAIAGGTPDALGALGVERGVGRVPGEPEENFRNRLGQLADIISPASHIRILDRILGSRGIGYDYLETGDVDTLMGFTWGVHPWGVGTLNPTPEPPTSQLVGQGIVWLSTARQVRYFVVLVQSTGLGEFGMPWGSPVYPDDHPNAWGLGIWGGGPSGFDALIAQLWEELNAARAAGVAFQIFLR